MTPPSGWANFNDTCARLTPEPDVDGTPGAIALFEGHRALRNAAIRAYLDR